MTTKALSKKKMNSWSNKLLNHRNVAISTAIIFLVSLLPIIYVGLFNYTSGDDYWFGVNTYQGWLKGGLPEALKGSFRTVAEFYRNWQGTWFTLFLFTLSPNIFWEGGYVIVVFISLGCLIFSYAYLADFYLGRKLGFRRSTTAVLVCLLLYLSLQYIPRTTSGIYWFNGIMHYSIPFVLAVLAIVHSQKYIDRKRKRDYLILFISFLLLGGGSYLAPLAAALTVCLQLFCEIKFSIENKRIEINFDKRNLMIIPAFIAEGIGLIISFMAPGNKVRGGEEFGFDAGWIIETIKASIKDGISDGIGYFQTNYVITVTYVLIFFLLWYEIRHIRIKERDFRLPLIFVIFMNGVYWATYAPAIYSRSDVSGGVPNTYFHIFLIITLANMVYVHGWFYKKFGKKVKRRAENKKSYIYGAVLLLWIAAFSYFSLNDEIITTNGYCLEYIKSGELKSYYETRKKQHEILKDAGDTDVVVPELVGRYPLLHMELSEDPSYSKNVEMANFYNVRSVKAEMVE